MYVTPKYMKKFAVTPPCSRPPLAPGQEADPTSIKRGEDFPEEWAKRQAKLAKQAKDAVKKFNEDSTAAAAEASVRLKKSMAKKPAHKPSASSSMPSQPISSAKPSQSIPQAAPAPPKSSAAPTKSSAPVHLATCQRTTGISIASGASASSSAAPNSSTGPSLLRLRPLLDEALAQVLTRSRSPSKCRLKKTKLMMKNLLKSSETGKSGPLEPRAQMCLCFWIQS